MNMLKMCLNPKVLAGRTRQERIARLLDRQAVLAARIGASEHEGPRPAKDSTGRSCVGKQGVACGEAEPPAPTNGRFSGNAVSRQERRRSGRDAGRITKPIPSEGVTL